MVVQGTSEGTGSDRRKIKRLIRAAKQARDKTPPVAVSLSRAQDGGLSIRIPDTATRPEQSATLYLVTFERARTVRVQRGENRGRTLTHRNVVRHIAPVGTWQGGALEISVPVPVVANLAMEDGRPPPPRSAAVLVQAGGVRAILGAAVFPLD